MKAQARVLIITAFMSAFLVLASVSYINQWKQGNVTVTQSQAADGEGMMHIKGAVKEPGVYAFSDGATYEDLVALAGGFTETADAESVNLSALCTDGSELTVPEKELQLISVGDETASTERSMPTTGDTKSTSGSSKSTSKKSAKPRATAKPKPTLSGPIDLNTATKEEFELLYGIGEVLAERIVEDRETNGPFTSVDDLMRVKGIGQKKLDAIRDMIYVTETAE